MELGFCQETQNTFLLFSSLLQKDKMKKVQLGVPRPLLEESLPKNLQRLQYCVLKHPFSPNWNLFQGLH